MNHIFLSYAAEDLERATPVAKALERAGFAVWWDRELGGGAEYSKEIEQALQSALAVVVLWSKSSVDSAWVRDEAAQGRDSGRLVPASLDGTPAPLGFGQLHTIDLHKRSRGRGDGISRIVAAVAQKAGKASAPQAGGELAEDSGSSGLTRNALAVTAVLALIAAALLYVLQSAGESTSASGKGGIVAVGAFEAIAGDPSASRVGRLTGEAIKHIFATDRIETVEFAGRDAPALRQADFAVSGTVDRQGNEVKVSANVSEATSGKIFWSTERRRPASEGRQLANEFALWLGDVIRCTTFIQSRMREYQSTELTSRLFRWCEAERGVGAQMPAIARELVEAAPRSAQAHGYLAMGLALARPMERDEIRAASRRALELDQANGPAHFALATMPDPEVSLAQREKRLRAAIRLDPAFPYTKSQLALLMLKVGRHDEATTLLEDFVTEYPLDLEQRSFWAFHLARAGKLRQSREEFDRIHELQQGHWVASVHAITAEILFGDTASARSAVERWRRSKEDRRCALFIIDALEGGRRPGDTELGANCASARLMEPELANGLFGNVNAAFKHLEPRLKAIGQLPRAAFSHLYYAPLAATRADRRFIPALMHTGVPQYWLESGKWPDYCGSEKPLDDCRREARAALAAARRK